MKKIMGVNMHETKIRIFSHYIIKCHYSTLSCEIFIKKIKIKNMH
jgi:hypothetical protein